VGIGASAGGPQALQALLAEFPTEVPVPILVVQHIPPRFVTALVRRLQESSPLPVRVASAGEVVRAGLVYVAPGGRHLMVRRGLRGSQLILHLSDGPPRHGVRPAADLLFRSLADSCEAGALVVVLTGMGKDGLEGVRAVKAKGGVAVAEAEESAVVYGMPRALAEAALADVVVPLPDMPRVLRELLRERAAMLAAR
jgi:two-component system chemotaxis response regulator CheB